MAIALETTAKGTNQTGSSVTSIASNAVATITGWLAIVVTRTANSVAINAPTDTAGNIYTAATAKTASEANDNSLQVHYCENITGHASNVVTAHFASAPYVSVVVAYVSGIATSSSLNVSDTESPAPEAASITSSPWSTVQGREIVFSVMTYGDNNLTFSAGAIAGTTGTIATTSGAANSGDTGLIYRILSTIVSTQTATCNVSASVNDLQLHTVSFKAPAPTAAVTGTATESITEADIV